MNSCTTGDSDHLAYVESFRALLHYPMSLPDVSGPAPSPRPADRTRPIALLVSPHPDDECLTGGLALRLQREAGFEILNVAATLGSHAARRSERWNELGHACARLGFALVDPAFEGHFPMTLARRRAEPESWSRDVERLAALLDDYRPRLILCPHEHDGSATHIGTHWLVRDALRRYPHAVWLAQTEFWASLDQPNLLVELDNPDVAALLGALTCHRGEIARNPYHLRLTSWLADSVRRGGEAVFGAGTQPPSFAFGALYQLDRWTGKQLVRPAWQMAIGTEDRIQRLFDEAG